MDIELSEFDVWIFSVVSGPFDPDIVEAYILDGEDFATIARQNSDDASSVVGGGDLDWVNEGGMPPEMEQVVDALEIDGVSEPFRSQVGWHVARVEGRRLQDLSREFTRNQAANALRNRKFELELEN